MINLYLRNLKEFKIRTMSMDETLQITSSMDDNFFPFFKNEINYIFKIFDPKNIFKNDVLPALENLCKNDSKMKQDMIELYDNYQDSLRVNGLLTRRNREMEYGLRVAEKALNNSLAITKEINDGV